MNTKKPKRSYMKLVCLLYFLLRFSSSRVLRGGDSRPGRTINGELRKRKVEDGPDHKHTRRKKSTRRMVEGTESEIRKQISKKKLEKRAELN